VNLVGFIIKKFGTMHGHMNAKNVTHLVDNVPIKYGLKSKTT